MVGAILLFVVLTPQGLVVKTLRGKGQPLICRVLDLISLIETHGNGEVCYGEVVHHPSKSE